MPNLKTRSKILLVDIIANIILKQTDWIKLLVRCVPHSPCCSAQTDVTPSRVPTSTSTYGTTLTRCGSNGARPRRPTRSGWPPFARRSPTALESRTISRSWSSDSIREQDNIWILLLDINFDPSVPLRKASIQPYSPLECYVYLH